MHNGDLVTLACFCDASSLSFCAAVYTLVSTDQGIRSNILLFAKTRVAPMKRISMPRMELVAMMIGGRAVKFLRQHLGRKSNLVVFGDSRCVLQWVRSTAVSIGWE
jgi:allantoicase